MIKIGVFNKINDSLIVDALRSAKRHMYSVDVVQLMCVCRAVTDYRSMSYVSADVNRLRLYVIRSVRRSTVVIQLVAVCVKPRVGPGHPCSPLSIYFIFSPFTFSFLSLA